MRRIKTSWIIFSVLSVLLLGAVALTGGLYFKAENITRNSDFLALNEAQLQLLRQSNQSLLTLMQFQSFEPGKPLSVSFSLNPLGTLSSNASDVGDSDNSVVPVAPVCVDLDDQSFNFSAGDSMSEQNSKVQLSGDINWYPFDIYTGFMSVSAAVGQNNGDCGTPIPIAPAVGGALQGYTVSIEATPDKPINGVSFSSWTYKFTAKRAPATRAFAILIFIIMWSLTISVFILSAWIWLTGRRTELPIISICTGLLFALPNVRKAQPGIPNDVGIIADLVGYVWCILLVSGCVVALIINWIYRKDGKKKKPVVLNPFNEPPAKA